MSESPDGFDFGRIQTVPACTTYIRTRGHRSSAAKRESQLESVAGNADAALRTLTDSLPERIELSGTHHRETAVLVNNIGNAYFPRIRARAWSTSTWRMATAAAARK